MSRCPPPASPCCRSAAGAVTGAVLIATLAGCGVVPTTCSDDLRVTLTPRERAVAVGESFTPTVALYGCGGTRRLADTFTWAAQDTAVARVEAGTGRTTGRAPGETLVVPTGARYGATGAIQVTVLAAP